MNVVPIGKKVYLDWNICLLKTIDYNAKNYFFILSTF